MAVSIDALYVKNRRMNAWHVEELEGEDEFPPCDQLGFVLVAFAAEGVGYRDSTYIVWSSRVTCFAKGLVCSNYPVP